RAARRIERRDRLLRTLLDARPQLAQALLALPGELLHLDELLLHGDEVGPHVAAHLNQVRLLRGERLLHGGDERTERVDVRRALCVGARPLGAQRFDLELDLPDVPFQSASGGEPQGDHQRRFHASLPASHGCRKASPPAMISVSSRRFWAHAASSCPCARGRSSPYDTVSMRAASMPWLTRYCFAAVARRLPRARLYSSDPRSSQCPLMRIRRLGFACRIAAF